MKLENNIKMNEKKYVKFSERGKGVTRLPIDLYDVHKDKIKEYMDRTGTKTIVDAIRQIIIKSK